MDFSLEVAKLKSHFARFKCDQHGVVWLFFVWLAIAALDVQTLAGWCDPDVCLHLSADNYKFNIWKFTLVS